MYTIIGGDGKQYGPISAEDLRKWVAEGRLNAQSQIMAEGGAGFRPLSAFLEFADLFAAQARSVAPPSGAERAAALQAVKSPAIALMVTAGLGIAYYLLNIVLVLSGAAATFQRIPPDAPPWVKSFMEGTHGPMAVVVAFLIIALDGFVLYGAIKMLRLQNYGVAMAAAIIAMLPCQCCCVLGLPFGIWALVVLNRLEVKSHFH